MPISGGLLQGAKLPLQPLSGGFSPNQGKSKEQLDTRGGEEEEKEQVKGGGIRTSKNQNRKQVRRSRGNKDLNFNVFSTNAASLVHPSKKFSLKQELQRTHATAFTIQETCFKTKGTFKLHDFITFEAIQTKEKSGIMIGAHKSLSPVLVSEYNKDFELIVSN